MDHSPSAGVCPSEAASKGPLTPVAAISLSGVSSLLSSFFAAATFGGSGMSSIRRTLKLTLPGATFAAPLALLLPAAVITLLTSRTPAVSGTSTVDCPWCKVLFKTNLIGLIAALATAPRSRALVGVLCCLGLVQASQRRVYTRPSGYPNRPYIMAKVDLQPQQLPVAPKAPLFGQRNSTALTVLAGQLRQVLYHRCLPRLCTDCRRRCMAFLKRDESDDSAFPALSQFCQKCQRVLRSSSSCQRPESENNVQAVNKLLASGRPVNKGQSSSGNAQGSTTIADRFLSFVASVYSGYFPSSEQTPLPASAPKSGGSGIITRQKVDSTSIYPYLTALNRPWCRYCGVTASSQWKDGPWGAASLCCAHGPDADGCVRYDLGRFDPEGRTGRTQPILSGYCCKCWQTAALSDCQRCNGCSLTVHAGCSKAEAGVQEEGHWYCSPECLADRRKRIVRGKIGFDERMPFVINPVVDSPKPTRRGLKGPSSAVKGTAAESDNREKDIFVPRFSQVSPVAPSAHSPSKKRSRQSAEEDEELADLDEERCTKRHCRFESIEKTNHLLRPQLLRKLFGVKPARAGVK